MKRLTVFCLTALAVWAAAVASASATQGPFFKIAGTRLKEKQTDSFAGKASSNFVLSAEFSSVTCKKLATGVSVLRGSTGAIASEMEMRLELSECSVSGNGVGCTVENSKVLTNLLDGEMGYATGTRTGKMLIFVIPKPATEPFATIHFVGGSCLVKTATIEGSICAEAWSGGKAIEIGHEPAERRTNEINFPSTAVTSCWTEATELTLGQRSGDLKWGSIDATLSGQAEVTVGTEEWGMYAE
jgi:hypothetical protein